MPFIKVNPIEEAKELQEIYANDIETKNEFKKFEEAHIEAEKLQYKELELRNKLVELRKSKNITQQELEEKTGLSQQAISRLEIGKNVSPSLKTLLKYAEAIGCQLVPQSK